MGFVLDVKHRTAPTTGKNINYPRWNQDTAEAQTSILAKDCRHILENNKCLLGRGIEGSFGCLFAKRCWVISAA